MEQEFKQDSCFQEISNQTIYDDAKEEYRLFSISFDQMHDEFAVFNDKYKKST